MPEEKESALTFVREVLASGITEESVSKLLEQFQPYDLAEVFPELERDEQYQLLSSLPADLTAEILEHLPFDEQYRILDDLDKTLAREIVNAMSSDALADLVMAIHPRQGQRLLSWLSEDYQAQITALMAYPDDTAGSLATVDYIAAREHWTAKQALDHVRKVGREAEIVSYIYVLDAKGRLVGVTSLRDLILSPVDAKVGDVMNSKVVSVSAHADQEEVANTLANYDFVAVPVVDDARRMVGIVTVDDVLDVIKEEATEDFQLIGGSQPLDEPYLKSSLLHLFRKRIGWLLLLFVAGALTSNILAWQADALEKAVSLAFFIPLLIGTGGNSGSQAATLVIRAIAVGEVSTRDFLRVIWREARLGVALGLTMGMVMFIRALTLGESPSLGITVAFAIVAIVTFSSSLGATLPIIGKRLGFDPAVFSAPMISTLVDATGLLIYFQVARWILGI
ncbi:MAG: magnesium transporter [Bacillota bacterium]